MIPSRKKTVKKPVSKKSFANSKKKVSKKSDEVLKNEIMNLAHLGTKEGLQKISEKIDEIKDEDLKDFARLAYEEGEMFYYFPESEQEEKDLLLAKMIYDTEELADKLFQKVQNAEFKLNKLELDRAVYKKILKSKKNQKFKQLFNEEYYKIAKNELSEMVEELDYKLLWVEEAKKMIKNEKYNEIPASVFECLHFDEEDDFYDDGWSEEDAQESNFELDEIMDGEEIGDEIF